MVAPPTVRNEGNFLQIICKMANSGAAKTESMFVSDRKIIVYRPTIREPGVNNRLQ